MGTFVGLDVGKRRTAVCIIGNDAEPLLEVSLPTCPDSILGAIMAIDTAPEMVGMESSSTSGWLVLALRERGLPAHQLEAARVRQYTKASPYKSDRTDARAIARMLKGGLYRLVYEKSDRSRATRSLLAQRAALIVQVRSMAQGICGSLEHHGIIIPNGSPSKFVERVNAAIKERPQLAEAIRFNLKLWEQTRSVLTKYDRLVQAKARKDPRAVLL